MSATITIPICRPKPKEHIRIVSVCQWTRYSERVNVYHVLNLCTYTKTELMHKRQDPLCTSTHNGDDFRR